MTQAEIFARGFQQQDELVASIAESVDKMADSLSENWDARVEALPAIPTLQSLQRRLAVYASALDRLERVLIG